MKNCSRLLVMALLVSIALASWSQVQDDEIALYSASGKPVAYISGDDLTIYLWSGKPVAYVQGEHIYGFNGSHLGWFKAGVIYDHDGERVGATRSKLGRLPQLASLKSLKELKPLKSLRELPPIKPIFSYSWSSDNSLVLFLSDGAD